MEKERIDILLVNKGHFTSRQQAQRSILAGLVFVNEECVDKVGTKVPSTAYIKIKGQLHPYVSRGGLKLEKALDYFKLDIRDKVMLDIGASTGGFTDCALQRGAKLVYAIDVGYGQLAWSIRQDPRVIVMERTNFRYLELADLVSDGPNFATIDVSFISLKHILTPLTSLLQLRGQVIALIKPQFEAGKDQIGKKGVVKDAKVHKEVLLNFVRLAESLEYNIQGITYSPIQGGEGNIEFLAYLTKEESSCREWDMEIQHIVNRAHQSFSKD